MLRIAEELARSDYAVTLATHRGARSEGSAAALPPGIDCVELPAGRSLAAVAPLARLLKRLEPEFLLSALPHCNLVALAARRLAGTGCKVVVSLHAPMRQQIDSVGGWRYRSLLPLLRLAYARADAIVAVSGGIRDELQAMFPKLRPAVVIRNPVLPPDWQMRAALPVEHPWLNDPALAVVLSVSRLNEEKDLSTLIRAFAIVADRHPNARLVLGGEGPQSAELRQLANESGIGDRVDLPGLLQSPLAWMRHARVFVLASRFEGFGNVLIEALAVGTPVVSTDCPVGPREALDQGRLGTLVPVGDSKAMADAIGAAFAGTAVSPSRAEQAVGHYTQRRTGEAFDALLSSLPC